MYLRKRPSRASRPRRASRESRACGNAHNRILKSILILLLLVPVLRGGTVFGQALMVHEDGLSVEELISEAEKGSVDLNKAARSLKQAQRGLAVPFTLEKSKLSLAARYGYTVPESSSGGSLAPGGTPASESHSLTASANVDLPILPQIILGGSVDLPLYDSSARDKGSGELTGSVSFTAYPFASPVFIEKSSAVYTRALYTYQDRLYELAFSVEEAVLTLLRAHKERTDAEEDLYLKTEEYEIAKQKYDLRESTFDELTGKSNALTEARHNFYTKEKALLSAERNFYGTIGTSLAASENGSSPGVTRIKSISMSELLKGIENRKTVISTIRNKTPESLALALLRVELMELKAEEEITWNYRPDIAVTAAMDIPLQGISAGITYSFSPEDVNLDEKTTLKENILTKEEEIAQELFNLQKEKQMLFSQIRTAEELIVLNRSAFEDALLTLEEARFLAGEGDRTKIELSQAKLSVQAKETALYASLADLYSLQGELIKLFPDTVLKKDR